MAGNSTSEKVSSEDQKLQALFENSTEGIMVSDTSGRIVMANPTSAELFGYQRDELIGASIDQLVPKDKKEDHKTYREDYIHSPEPRSMGKGRDLHGLRKDGTTFPVEISLTHFKTDEGMFVMSFIIDISDRKEQEEALRKEKERTQRYLDIAATMILVTNKDGQVELINKKGCEILGKKEEEVIGTDWFENFIPERKKESARSFFESVISGEIEAMEEFESPVIDSNGEERILHFYNTPLYSDDGNSVHGSLSSAVDVTETKAYQAKLREYAKDLESSNRELEQFAYVASHDLQEPLRKIQAFSDRLARAENNNLSDKGKDYLERMSNAAIRMRDLINDLLAFSRVTSKAKPFSSLDLNRILYEVLSDLEITIEKENVRVEADELPTIKGDHTQIRQLFQNLLSNSIKFRQKDIPPVITITATEMEEEGNRFLRVSFADNGIGFDPKFSERIFNIFQQVGGKGFKGSGIGLAICKKIVERHGGTIKAESEPGKGTRFHIQFPL